MLPENQQVCLKSGGWVVPDPAHLLLAVLLFPRIPAAGSRNLAIVAECLPVLPTMTEQPCHRARTRRETATEQPCHRSRTRRETATEQPCHRSRTRRETATEQPCHRSRVNRAKSAEAEEPPAVATATDSAETAGAVQEQPCRIRVTSDCGSGGGGYPLRNIRDSRNLAGFESRPYVHAFV
jgi:hypothetical protein